MDVLAKASIETKLVGGQFVGGHPIHGSTNNNNFVVSPEKNVWHCFRCGSGGGAVALIAVLERVMDCREAVPGGLRGDKFTQTLKIANEKYGFQIKREPQAESCLISEDRLSEIETRIQAIAKDTAPVMRRYSPTSRGLFASIKNLIRVILRFGSWGLMFS